MEVEAFNQKHTLRLKPASSPLGATFRLQKTSKRDQGPVIIDDLIDTTEVTSLYEDPTTGAMVRVEGDKVEGLITPTLTLRTTAQGTHEALRQYTTVSSTSTRDYLEVPKEVRKSFKSSKKVRGTVSVTPEIYVIVDSTLSAALGSNKKIQEYLAVFWNGVNQRFATIDDPKINLVLSGALIVRDSADESYINDNVLVDNYIHGSNTLKSLSDWLFQNKDDLPAYDVAYLMTGKDMADVESGMIQQSLAGIAWKGAACLVAEGNKRSFNTGMGEDKDVSYSGVMTAAHEVAHNLGSPHDGVDESKSCPWHDGYIMSYITGNSNKFFFSSCSKQLMKEYLSSDYASCLKVMAVGATISLSSVLPGELVTMDQQCQKLTGRSEAYASASVSEDSLCVQLVCQWKIQQGKYIFTHNTGQPAAEGSACRSGEACINGSCQSRS